MEFKLVTLSLLMVCLSSIEAGTLGGNSPASNSDPQVKKAENMVEQELQKSYPGVKISNFKAQQQVVNGIRYNITFSIEYTPECGQPTKKECNTSLVEPAGSQNLQFVSENGSEKINCS